MTDDDDYDESYQIKLANACEDIINACNLQDDIYFVDKRGNALNLRILSSNKLSFAEKEEIFAITEMNMKNLYIESQWGWNALDKRNELFHPLSRFLIYFDESLNKIIGFIMFRFEFDDEDEPDHIVLYCYEFQVNSSNKGNGIGSKVSQLRQSLINDI